MSQLTRQEALRVAQLAALELDADEADAMCAQLGAVLAYMSELETLELDAVEPTAHPVALAGALREDQVRQSMPREEFLRAAPATEAGGFAVPRVLDGDA
jgi:aspartyl-tRNA(Asn)/glutamyl-tRNA(Gln) amidotransferase subunit C